MTVREMLSAIDAAVQTHQTRGGGGGHPWDIAIFLAGMRAGAEEAERSWKDGYRGEVNSGFKFSILSAADQLAANSGQPKERQA